MTWHFYFNQCWSWESVLELHLMWFWQIG
uniref:Uncharacterized protein n=1 Tax=Rhizophora mucronata TaxID=61149 RepID=A0A2P2IHE1_RHIMU